MKLAINNLKAFIDCKSNVEAKGGKLLTMAYLVRDRGWTRRDGVRYPPVRDRFWFVITGDSEHVDWLDEKDYVYMTAKVNYDD